MWFGTRLRSIATTVERISLKLTVIKVATKGLFKSQQALVDQVTTLTATIAEMKLSLEALHQSVQRLSVGAPVSRSADPLELKLANLFDELPLGNPQGFTMSELEIDAGYKEQHE